MVVANGNNYGRKYFYSTSSRSKEVARDKHFSYVSIEEKRLFFNIDDFNNFQGIEFETFPSALSLAAMSGPHKVSLVGVPKGTGILKILGYTCTVLGVKSTCKLAR